MKHFGIVTRKRPSRARPIGLLARLCFAIALFLGCGDDSSNTEIVYQAPVKPRAMWVLEPATIGIGDVATLEVAVVTRPNHRVLPFATPQEVPGLWILQVETLPVAREPNRWIHRTRVRVRPREIGEFAWPSTRIEVEGDGVVETLAADGITVEVVSILPKYIGKLTPFGLPPQLVEPSPGNPWAWAAGGAGFVLGCFGLVWLSRREPSPSQTSTNRQPAGTPVWQIALEALEASLAQVDREPLQACESVSAALRCYMDRRYGATTALRTAGALTSTISSTTEELERATPPFAATSRWPAFVSLLRRIDEFRFPAPTGSGAEIREIILEAAEFVRNTIPNETTR